MLPLSMTLLRCAAIVTLAAAAGFLGGCSSSSVAPVEQNVAPARRIISDGYSFQAVGYPNEPDNEITAINNNGEILGNYSTSFSYSSDWTSYVSKAGYSSYAAVVYPAARSTYLYAINDAANIIVGFVSHPQELDNQRWGTEDLGGLWSLLPKLKDEKDCTTQTHELTGFDNNNNSNLAVGYWNDPHANCAFRPFELSPGGNVDYAISNGIPAAWGNTEATAIASNDDVVGSTAGPGSTPPAGWFQATGSAGPREYWCCGGSTKLTTTFNGVTRIGSADIIVGTYTVSSKTHGFIFNEATNVWTYPVDYPGSNYTVINGINTAQSICGWYQEPTSGNYNGFVGTVTIPSGKHRSK